MNRDETHTLLQTIKTIRYTWQLIHDTLDALAGYENADYAIVDQLEDDYTDQVASAAASRNMEPCTFESLVVDNQELTDYLNRVSPWFAQLPVKPGLTTGPVLN